MTMKVQKTKQNKKKTWEADPTSKGIGNLPKHREDPCSVS